MICVENFSDIPRFGRFALRSEGKTITWGKVIGLFSGGGSGSSTGFSTKVGSNLERMRLSLLKHVPDSEIKASIKQLYMCVNYNKNGPVPIEIKQWFGDLTLNVILRMIVGKRYLGAVSDNDESEARRCQKAMREFMKLSGVFIVDDAVPYFRWLDLQGYKKKMRNISKELDCFFQGWLEEKQRKRVKRLSGDAKEEQDFMDVLISKLEHTQISDYDNDTIIKSACLQLKLVLLVGKPIAWGKEIGLLSGGGIG
ncbi:Cytochrome p450 [Thalictrum thalictroides]|uniref:Cytochrome p450 n=1 Tax=Thalictrum thalictroides TaxID=46969 RepID=A0A7J6WVN4_THATH|nr:Cytochrome p450 [Thalictrum thalictroides]